MIRQKVSSKVQMLDKPDVSVIVPVHNGMPFLPSTIESLRGQTFRNFEVVVVDDESEDDTPRYLQAIDDDRIRYFRVPRRGIAAALNFGIEQSRAELIARIDADDIAYRDRLSTQYDVLSKDPTLVLLGTSFDTIDDAGAVTGEWHCLQTDLANRWLMLFTTPFAHPSVMFRKSAFEAAGGYDPECVAAQDYDLWIRLADQGAIGNVPQKLIQKRSHAQTWSLANPKYQRERSIRTIGRYAAKLKLGPNPQVFCELYSFLWGAGVSTEVSGKELFTAFDAASSCFRSKATSKDDETIRSINFFTRRFSERCLEQVRRCWRSPLLSASWLSLARSTDPIYVRSTIRRKAFGMVYSSTSRPLPACGYALQDCHE